ncbi:hypothetical protein [Thioflexithrix psekupsensis]|nr:hypothetical protein [Thioflexithrix psekupsensis]
MMICRIFSFFVHRVNVVSRSQVHLGMGQDAVKNEKIPFYQEKTP